MMSFLKFIVIFLSISNIALASMLFDSSDTKRKITDNILDMLEKMRNRMHIDMTDLGIPRLDPWLTNGLGLGTEFLDGATLTTSNVNVIGLKSFTVNEVNFNIFGMEFLLDFLVPTLLLTGEYEADGLIGKLFPFKGKGHFNMEISNVTLKCDGRLRYSNDTWSLPDLTIYFAIDELKGDFKDLSDSFVNDVSDVGPNMLKEVCPYMQPSVTVAAKEFMLQRLEKTSLHIYKMRKAIYVSLLLGQLMHFNFFEEPLLSRKN